MLILDIYEIHFPVFITEINPKTSLLPRIIHKQSVADSTHLNNYKKESDNLLTSLLQEDISRENEIDENLQLSLMKNKKTLTIVWYS